MILFINTFQIDLIQVKLIKNDKVVCVQENHDDYKQSELLLTMIDKIIRNLKFEIRNLTAIAVVSGPGAFSALRLGITTANTLAWSLGILVMELSADEVADDEILIEVLKNKIKDQRPKTKDQFKSVVPKYGREPNITKAQEQ